MTVRLEPWGEGDLPLLEKLLGDPEMTVHLGGPESPEKLAVAETGQYGSSLRVKFRVPSYRFIPRYQSHTYSLTMEAAAPNGDEKTSRRTVYVRSCRR